MIKNVAPYPQLDLGDVVYCTLGSGTEETLRYGDKLVTVDAENTLCGCGHLLISHCSEGRCDEEGCDCHWPFVDSRLFGISPEPTETYTLSSIEGDWDL
jgi:hypothetical protein